MANLVLIPGSGHGGWWFDPIVPGLESLGHRVFTISLAGLDYQNPDDSAINVDTHIKNVLDLISSNGLEEVVLIAHSYGGMVMTGVADRTTAKVHGLVYLDAMLPASGQKLWDLISTDMQKGFLESAHDGLRMYPDPEFLKVRPRMMPQPLACMLQPVTYNEAIFEAPTKVYVWAEKFFGIPEIPSPFEPIYNRLRAQEGWQTYSVPYGHDLVEECPGVVLELLKETIPV